MYGLSLLVEIRKLVSATLFESNVPDGMEQEGSELCLNWEGMLTGGKQGDDCDKQGEGACGAPHKVSRHIVVLHNTAWHPFPLLDLQPEPEGLGTGLCQPDEIKYDWNSGASGKRMPQSHQSARLTCRMHATVTCIPGQIVLCPAIELQFDCFRMSYHK